MRILFMGTPEFAVPSLAALVQGGHTVCGAFSQPDKPVGRHQTSLQQTPVKEYCLAHMIPVVQPLKLRDGAALEQIRTLDPELIVVAAYGRILPEDILSYPKRGCINVHSSLLPKYRGAAPIHWAILNGETETGITILHMTPELDAGDIITQISTPIDPDETAEALYTRLADLGGTLLGTTVAAMERGPVGRIAQDTSRMTLAPMLSKELSPMDWGKTAQQLHNQVRGLLPWPVAGTELNGVRCKIFSTAVSTQGSQEPPGTVLRAGTDGIQVACGGGTTLRIDVLQAEGGKRMSAGDYLRGHPIPSLLGGDR